MVLLLEYNVRSFQFIEEIRQKMFGNEIKGVTILFLIIMSVLIQQTPWGSVDTLVKKLGQYSNLLT